MKRLIGKNLNDFVLELDLDIFRHDLFEIYINEKPEDIVVTMEVDLYNSKSFFEILKDTMRQNDMDVEDRNYLLDRLEDIYAKISDEFITLKVLEIKITKTQCIIEEKNKDIFNDEYNKFEQYIHEVLEKDDSYNNNLVYKYVGILIKKLNNIVNEQTDYFENYIKDCYNKFNG